ncbi:MAG: serine/threonine protein kinase [Proteobacteria bacterium]|nr:serine/threonine protein kinase [Pseudomonadota bacterium]
MLEPGSFICQYEIVRLVATGGMSQVYQARSTDDGQPAAVKVLHHEWCSDDELRARFCNEASVLKQIQHPHIVAVMGQGFLPERTPFMILEWLPASLDRVLAEVGGPLPYFLAARVAAATARALAALHQREIIHRDLKPSNVLLSSGDVSRATIKLSDLGLAKVRSTNAVGGAGSPLTAVPVSTGGSTMLGTWDYMAPEQWIESKVVTFSADVYALGILLFQMLTGHLPFVAANERDLMVLHLFEPPPWSLLDTVLNSSTPSTSRDRQPSDLRKMLQQMLNKKPGDRPPIETAIEWLQRR